MEDAKEKCKNDKKKEKNEAEGVAKEGEGHSQREEEREAREKAMAGREKENTEALKKVMSVEPTDKATKDFLKTMKKNHIRDLENQNKDQEAKDKAFDAKQAKRAEKDKKFSPNGNKWTADMP